LNDGKKAIFFSLAPIEVKILFFFSLKKKRLQRKAGRCLLKWLNVSAPNNCIYNLKSEIPVNIILDNFAVGFF